MLTDGSGETVDLDNSDTYKLLPNDLKELRNLMFKEIGFYICYVEYWYKEDFEGDFCGQKKRVDKLIQRFTDDEKENSNNIAWYQEMIFLFQDDTENMC